MVLIGGMIALAVPGSATFAGEFLIMAGVYGQGWGYSVVVALGVVLAAMYTLRLISAILHVKPGRAVREEALDLRAGELGLVIPLLLVLLGLSIWPALVSESSFTRSDARPYASLRDTREPVIDTPSVDWFALSPPIALLAAAGLALLSALLPEWMRKAVSATAALAGFVVAAALAVYLFEESSTPETLLNGSMTRDQLAAMAQAILGVTGAAVVLASWGERRRTNHAEYYALLATAGAGHGVLRERRQPHDALPRARVVLALPLHPRRDRLGA